MASRKRRLRARTFFENLKDAPDIYIQEHKLRAGRTHRLPYEVLHNSHFITALASDGIHATCNDQVDADKGGVSY